MSELMDLLDRLETMDFSEVEVEVEGITIKVKRAPKVVSKSSRSQPQSIEEFGGFTPAKEVKAPGLASSGQVKYSRDLLNKSFNENESEYMDFLAHTFEIALQDVVHPDTWDETMTRDMATVILTSLEQRNGIFKKR